MLSMILLVSIMKHSNQLCKHVYSLISRRREYKKKEFTSYQILENEIFGYMKQRQYRRMRILTKHNKI